MMTGGEDSDQMTPVNGSRIVSAAGRSNNSGNNRQFPMSGEDMSQVTFDEYGNRR